MTVGHIGYCSLAYLEGVLTVFGDIAKIEAGLWVPGPWTRDNLAEQRRLARAKSAGWGAGYLAHTDHLLYGKED